MNYKVLNSIFVLIGCVLSSEAYAECRTDPGFKSVDINMTVGRVVVRPSDPVGAILRRTSFPITANGSKISCDFNRVTVQAALTQNPSLSLIGSDIYNTNIEGIGLRLYRETSTGTGFSGYYPYTISTASVGKQ